MPDQYRLQVFSTLIYVILIFASVIITVMGSMILISLFTHRKIDIKEEILRNRNVGMALVLASFIWTIGRMCFESVKPIMNVWYNTFAAGFTLGSGITFIFGVLGSLLNALFIGAVTVFLSIKLLMVMTKGINEWEEMKRGNIAVAIVMAITVVVVGMFFESIISYVVMSIFDI